MLPVIALTGGIGSGKSSVTSILRELGAAIIDSDEIAHQLTSPGQAGADAIRRQFGPDFLRADGALDRARMRELVFADPAAKTKLESILHPMIRAAVNARIAAEQRGPAPYIVLAVPLLIETGAYRELAQRILVVDCDEALQVSRVVQRSGLDPDQVRAIMANQVSREARLRHADDVVDNSADLPALRSAVRVLHGKYSALAASAAKSRLNC
jgi:dephospho-CoA kinase